MKRRHFLQTTGAISLPVLLNGFKVSAASSGALSAFLNSESDRVLVLIQLNGGNDGLNTVVPLDQYDNLAAVRSNILLPKSSLLPINNTAAFHPRMTGMRDLFKEGRLAVVQSVGYPNENRSHFRSLDIWQTGSPANQFWKEGWIGRYLDQQYPDFPMDYPKSTMPHPIAITMGTTVSETCQGAAANFSLTLTDPFAIKPLMQGEEDMAPNTPYGRELSFLRTTIEQANTYGQVVQQTAKAGTNLATYPDKNRLAQQLKNVARLISGGMRTKVYVVSLGGFDTHANQVVNGAPTTGEHANLLGTLSEAVTPFMADLKAQGLEQRVVGMTFSEFGRRIRSNASFGTDHGTSAPLLLFGGCVNAGVLGYSPKISTTVNSYDGVAMQYDFRDVYGSVLMDWFAVPETTVRELLHTGFKHLPVLANCSSGTSVNSRSTTSATNDERPSPGKAKVFPNPFRDRTTVEFHTEDGEWVQLSVFNAAGAEIQTVMSGHMSYGVQRVEVDTSRWPSGTYFFRLRQGDRTDTQQAVKP